MIPKIIHFCWFGNGKKSTLIEHCTQSWRKFLPDYEIREWNESNFPLLQSNAYVREAYAAKKWAFVADVCRLYALMQDGGIYLDTDVEVCKNFDKFLKLDFFMGSEKNGKFRGIGTGVIGAAKGNKIIKNMLALYNDLHFVKADGSYDLMPNTKRLIPVLFEHGAENFYTEMQPIEISKKAKIYPINYFCVCTPESYAIHHFEASWIEDYKLRNAWHFPHIGAYRLSIYRYKKLKKNAVFNYPLHMITKFIELNYSKKWKILITLEKADFYQQGEIYKLGWKITKYYQKFGSNYKKFYRKIAYYAMKKSLKTINSKNNFGVDDNKIHLVVKLDGGLGDIIIALNYLQQLCLKMEFILSIIVPDTYKKSVICLLNGYNFVQNIYSTNSTLPKSDISIRLVRVPIIEFADLLKIKQLSPQMMFWVENLISFSQHYSEMLNSGTVSDFLLEKYSSLCNCNRLTQADIGGFIKPISKFKVNLPKNKTKVLQQFNLSEKFITVQRGGGVFDEQNLPQTRSWSVTNYNKLLGLIKINYPEYQIVQIGDKKCIALENTDLNLCGQTSFDELLVILNEAKLHIDGDCGMVHLRHFMEAKPSVVLFGPTSKKFYEYSENINISANVCTGCEWVTNDWMNRCIKTGSSADCMNSLTAETVMNEIKKCKGLD